MGIFYREKHFTTGKNQEKMTLPPPKNISLTPLTRTFKKLFKPFTLVPIIRFIYSFIEFQKGVFVGEETFAGLIN